MSSQADPPAIGTTWMRPYQRGLVRLWNRLARRSPRSSAAGLSPEELLESAARRARLTDFGSDSFLTPFTQLVASINSSAGLHPFGEFLARTVLIELLRNRLYVQKASRNEPDVDREEIRGPIVIVGLPRTGTTLLFELLAHDPSHRFLTNWESSRPVPPPGWWNGRAAARRSVSRVGLALQHYLAPSLRSIHATRVEGPEECTSLLMNEFNCMAFAAMFNVPEYLSWFADRELASVVRYHRRQLALIQRQRGGARWLLKSPNHLPAVADLVDVYPDVCIVHTHRDPLQAIPSCCSLVAAFRGIFSDRLRRDEIRSQSLFILEHGLQRSVRARERTASGRFFDVHYEDLIADPMRIVGDLYRYFRLGLTPEAERRMREASKALARRTPPRHRYSADQFGIEPASVRSQFEWYTTRFDVRLTSSR